MIIIQEQLINKRMVDIDDLLNYILNASGVDIGDDYYWDCFKESITRAFNEYTSMTVPDVEVGQTVWVIRKEYSCALQKMKTEIIECKVHKKTIKKKYTFSVRGKKYYVGTFTKNSIGKTVFFSEEEAKKHIKE